MTRSPLLSRVGRVVSLGTSPQHVRSLRIYAAHKRRTLMCYSRDYMSFEDQQKKAREQDRRNETINKLRDDAHKQGENAKETTAAEDLATAK